ncbi:MAG: hypothetical protein ACE5K0_12805, partial [Candidatus Methanofastidiosia archaeon]
EEHVKRVINLTPRVEELRKVSSSKIVLVVGNELSIDTTGILPGTSYVERIAAIKTWNSEHDARLNSYLNELIDEVRKRFGGFITYAAGSWENVEWGRPNIDIVGPNRYVYSTQSAKNYALRKLIHYKKYDKPVWVNEFGCKSYVGASRQEPYTGQPYSQEEQANNIRESLDFFKEVGGIDAAFLHTFIIKFPYDESLPNNADNSYNIMKYLSGNFMKRKLGAYLYTSFKIRN